MPFQLPLPWMDSSEGSPASPSPLLGGKKPRKTAAGSGPSSPARFASLNLDGSWLKMSQVYARFKGGRFSGRSSRSWPRTATMRTGIIFQRPPSERHTSGTGSGLWPTPTAQNPGAGPENAKVQNLVAGSRHSFYLTHAVEAERQHPGVITGRWPTPTTQDSKNRQNPSQARRHSPPLTSMVGGGPLNPTWVEWLMGFPSGWTDLEP